ncbi:hypothetical protein BJ508DRAFT_418446 [Ascobolus immersus RN42]|uniref:Uncharacterized protein n=1 Tax=Ascobolus immersus RN42 TaxID=1160509 RepID=A0A3N4HP95_ASCIM|nr:hypothetical protein BJ508DRAFT_418446 [Ascobolus immersus RN42]
MAVRVILQFTERPAYTLPTPQSYSPFGPIERRPAYRFTDLMFNLEHYHLDNLLHYYEPGHLPDPTAASADLKDMAPFSILGQTGEDLRQFFKQVLFPYLEVLRSERDLEGVPPEATLRPDNLDIHIVGDYFATMFDILRHCSKRRDAGLLRDTEIRLFVESSKRMMQNIGCLIEQDRGPSEIYLALKWWRSYPFSLFLLLESNTVGGRGLRSESCEARILKYLDEPGVNMEVVKGVEAATEQFAHLCICLGVFVLLEDYFIRRPGFSFDYEELYPKPTQSSYQFPERLAELFSDWEREPEVTIVDSEDSDCNIEPGEPTSEIETDVEARVRGYAQTFPVSISVELPPNPRNEGGSEPVVLVVHVGAAPIGSFFEEI